MTNATKSKRRIGRPPKAERRTAQRRARRRAVWAGLATTAIAGLLLAAVVSLGGGVRTAPAAVGTVEVAGAARDAHLEAGERLPSFAAPALGGGEVTWTPGEPTVLAVWAPWCPHCQVELPVLAAVAVDHPEVSLVSVTTAIDLHPGPDPAAYMADHGLRFPVAIDDQLGTLAGALGIQGFPTVYYVGSDGVVEAATVGEVDRPTLRELFSLLA